MRVQVAQATRVDASLDIGTTTETVSVTAEASMLKTDNAQQGINVSGDRINELPLNFGGGGGNVGAIRNWLGFITLAPGVSGTNERASVNGAPGGAFKIYLEGQDVTSSNDTVWTSTVAAASVETIGEFSMQTANFSAEYGQVLGGVFNFTTKSGTNELHGSVYDYVTNEALDAHRPFTGALPLSRKHNFGFSAGGPVYIPGLYYGRNKTFFFANLEVFRNRTNSPGVRATVPTDAYRNGDFSAALTGRVLGHRSARPADHGERDLRSADDAGRERPGRARSVPEQRHPAEPVRSGRAADPVAHPARRQRRDPEQLVARHPEPPLPDDPDGEDRSQLRRRDAALGLLVGAVHRSDHRAGRVPGADHLAARPEDLRPHDPREPRQDAQVEPAGSTSASAISRFHNPDSSPDDVLDFDAAQELGFVGSATTPAGFPVITGLAATSPAASTARWGPATPTSTTTTS